MNTARDPLRFFRVEAQEISEELSRGALQIERDAKPEFVERLMRLAHTLKGAASVVKQREIAELTHELEDALTGLRDEGEPSRGSIEAIFAHVDAIAARVASLAPASPTSAAHAPDDPSEQLLTTLRADIAEVYALLEGVSEASAKVRSLRRTIATVEHARQLADLLAERTAPRPLRLRAREESRSAENPQMLAAEIQQLLATLDQQIKTGLDQSERELRQAHAAGERIRLLPCSLAFAQLERAVRDAALSHGKQAMLEIKGGDVRLDGHVLELVQRALVQILRNAVVHGIESPAERKAAGKPEVGHIEIEVARRGERVLFICSDDGAGIDIDAVRRAADARGVLPEIATGSESDGLLDLLFRGGLSTSGAVTEASGRGIGLAVVREVATRLGGSVTARSERGAGTRIELVVPVQLAALDALFVEAAGSTAAIPLGAVRRAVRLADGDVSRTAEGNSVLHDGDVIPFMPLARSIAAARPAMMRPIGARSAVVVEADDSMVAFEVDRLLGATNVVVRSLPPLAHAAPVVSGICLDAAGIPQAVLDPKVLVRSAREESQNWDAPPACPAAPILVIDDSLTTRVLEQSILETAGYDVDLATSAEEALEMARTRRYGLFLVDVEMPGMDGYAFIETIRADSDLRGTPAILVTSRAAAEDRQRGLEAGASAYMVKSDFDQGKFLEMVKGLLR